VGKIDWRAEVGDTAERLAAVADDEKAALIMLGSRTRKAGAARHSRLASEIAKKTAVPVALPAEGQVVTGGRKTERLDDDRSRSDGGLDAAAPGEPREEAA
jgi:hypothetical protein